MARNTESSIVAKCAQVMDVLSAARQPLAFSEIVQQTGFVKSSCHRILGVLQAEELVSYDDGTRTYRTGARLNNWARSAWQRVDLQQAAGKPMTALSESSGLNAALSILDSETILYLRTADQIPVRYAARAGDHAPLHCTAAGKLFLAHMAEKSRKQVLSSLKLERYTEFTKTSVEELVHELPGIAIRGYAIAEREEFLHVSGIAAPVRNAQGDVTAALSLWMIHDDQHGEGIDQHADSLKAAALAISKGIGWQPE